MKWKGWVILLLIVGVVGYFNRWVFVYKFEPEYWENYYYTSQWNIANSKRVIGDEGVYRYIGYRLVNGENPFNVDYWVPPMGKFWYGVGAKFLENPYWISFVFYCLSILAIKLLTKNWLVVYLWALNPIVVEQIGQTMLDLPVTLFFLIHVYFLFQFGKNKSFKTLLLAGIFLGLMAGTKPAYFVPMIGIIDWWWIYKIQNKRAIKYWAWYAAWVFGGYVLAYTCYFLKHPNPIPWLRLHDKVIAFQRGNGGSHDVMNIFKTIFLNKYKGFWVGGKEILTTGWSLILPIGTLCLGNNLLWIKKELNQNKKNAYLTLVGVGYILMNLTIDFWPRYLVFLLPMLILIIGEKLKNKPIILGLLLISYLPWLQHNFWPKPETVKTAWSQEINDGHYREAYRLLDKNSREKIPEEEWLKYGSNNINNLPIETIKENNQWKVVIKN